MAKVKTITALGEKDLENIEDYIIKLGVAILHKQETLLNTMLEGRYEDAKMLTYDIKSMQRQKRGLEQVIREHIQRSVR